MTQSRVVTEAVEKQLDAQIAQDSDHTALLAAFRRIPANIPAARNSKSFATRAKEIYDRQFLLSWRKLQQFMNTTYARNVRPADSLSSIPQGRKRTRCWCAASLPPA